MRANARLFGGSKESGYNASVKKKVPVFAAAVAAVFILRGVSNCANGDTSPMAGVEPGDIIVARPMPARFSKHTDKPAKVNPNNDPNGP